MKLRISTGAACAFARLAIIARVACGVLIDMPNLMNAGWLSALLGAILSVPTVYAITQYRQGNRTIPRALYGVFSLIALCDAAAVSSCIADSASYMALNTSPAVYLMLPQLALCLFCLQLNGDALGTSAGIWSKILPWLLGVIILLQAKDYQPEWLSPILGPGPREILTGALRTAGWFTLPTALYMIAEPEIHGKSKPLNPMKTLFLSACFTVIICLLSGMTTPSILDKNLFTRAFRLDALLANGRTGLAQQLPAISLWYVGLFYALLFDIFTAASMMQRLFPKQNHQSCIWISLIIVSILGADILAGKSAALIIADWTFIAQSLSLACAMLFSLLKKEGERNG